MDTMRELLERNAESGEKLTLANFVPDRRDSTDEILIENAYMLIKGSPRSLRFLGELLIQFAEGNYGCSFDLHPQAAGSKHFSQETNLGLYFLKEPCDE